jgi:alanine dehydrogenase
MLVGLVKEIKNQEYRVGLTPNCVAEYVSAGHRVIFEKDAGVGSGFEDEEYIRAGGERIDAAADVWAVADMIVKVKEPIQSEYAYLKEGQILYTYLHLAANKPLTDALIEKRVSSVAYETIVDEDGGLPCLVPMSEIAGRMSVAQGAKYIEKTFGGAGILLAGVPGEKKADVMIIRGGTVGTEACKVAVGLGANVSIMDVSAKRLAYLDNLFGSRVQTLYSTPTNIRDGLKKADVTVGAVLLPGKKAPHLVKREDLALMKKGSVLVDVAVDQGGCFETTRATTHEEPTFIVDGVVHYCVANMPGAVARTATIALTNTTLRIGIGLANLGFKDAVKGNAFLKPGVNTYAGRVTCAGVADAFGYDCADIDELI